ncbi:hypothetical protein K492DRAFT_234025 [Lichtheimia hyalospora FSU 10163]|nr:hypothetical protein K492DRAFT_234025 [Lichtheimia hyalospora FSU 10163]
MEPNAIARRNSNSLYANDNMLVDQLSMSDNTRHVPTVVKHAEATSESDDVPDNMSIGSMDFTDLEPVLYNSPDRHNWKRHFNSPPEKSTKIQRNSDKGKHVMLPDTGSFYDVEDIVAHKVYRSQAVMYEIKWKGYDSRQNTWEIANHIHEDCPELCLAYWSKQKNTPIPKNVPRSRNHQQPLTATKKSYMDLLQKYNIDNDSLVPFFRKQGYRLSYDLDFPTKTTNWKKELRAIHFVQRVKSTDQMLAYVSWMNKKKTVHVVQELHEKCPDLLINYYESCLTFAKS